MIIIAAVDEKNGMLFHKRRQSQDRILRQKVLDLVKKHKSRIWMNAYTQKQFADCADRELLRIDEAFLEKAGTEDYCFVEDVQVLPYADAIRQVILFKWNRAYPGDFFFDLDMSRWKRIDTEEFSGSSHEKITMEVYEHEKE